MAAQEAKFHRVTQQVQVIQTAQSVADAQAVYPIYGEHIARNSKGFIDPKAKPPGALYLDINLSLAQTPNEVASLLPRWVESNSLDAADGNESGPHHHKRAGFVGIGGFAVLCESGTSHAAKAVRQSGGVESDCRDTGCQFDKGSGP